MNDRELIELAAKTKTEALSRGLTRYFTGKPCKRGHLSERNTSSGVCLECLRETSKAIYYRDRETRLKKCAEYREKNKEKISNHYKGYYAQHKEHRSLAYKAYRNTNKDKEKARHIKYRHANLDACKLREARYRALNKDKLRVKWIRRRARHSNAEGNHTAADIRALLAKQRARCACCRSKLLK